MRIHLSSERYRRATLSGFLVGSYPPVAQEEKTEGTL
jgi:hypothetical protein